MPHLALIASRLGPYGKVLSLILTMLLGAVTPWAGTLSFLVQYLLILMLFSAFLDMEVTPRAIGASVLGVLFANLALALGAYWVFSHFDHNLALSAFITASAPTAIASTVFIGFIGGRTDFMAAAVLITNTVTALFVPLVLPFFLQAETAIATWEVLRPVLITMFVPLILARLAYYLPSRAFTLMRFGRRFNFPLWLANLYIISAKASAFIRSEVSNSQVVLLQIALVSLVICVINFIAGALIGGRHYGREASQALGQKNNSFAIWVALAFINPLVAMGPTFYVLYHNLYNTWQIYRYERQHKAEVP